MACDEVSVHYMGTLQSDDSEFESSRSREKPLTFTLGQGQVIQDWDNGVAMTKQGEIAKCTLSLEFAHGEEGSPLKISANATFKDCFVRVKALITGLITRLQAESSSETKATITNCEVLVRINKQNLNIAGGVDIGKDDLDDHALTEARSSRTKAFSSATTSHSNQHSKQCKKEREDKEKRERKVRKKEKSVRKERRRKGSRGRRGQGGQEGRDGLDIGDEKQEAEEEDGSDLRQSGRVQGAPDGGESDGRQSR